MVGIDRSTLDEASRGARKQSFIQSLGGPQFLIAQFFTILATILGVYLAGYVGFQRTLQYDQLVNARQQSDLLAAMHAELEDNTARLRAFVDKLDPTGAKTTRKWPALRLYVWGAAQRSDSIFDTPPQTLAGMQAFYEEAREMLNNSSMREYYSRSTGQFTYDRTQFKEQFSELVSTAEQNLLPTLQQASTAAGTMVTLYSK